MSAMHDHAPLAAGLTALHATFVRSDQAVRKTIFATATPPG
jgi:hypothetical protein